MRKPFQKQEYQISLTTHIKLLVKLNLIESENITEGTKQEPFMTQIENRNLMTWMCYKDGYENTF